MAKIKHTKTELKAQREALSRFERFLPMLQLKKQQLQSEIQRIDNEIAETAARARETEAGLAVWRSLFNDPGADSDALRGGARPAGVDLRRGNIAGVDIPVFGGLRYAPVETDLFLSPAWTDEAVLTLRRQVEERVRTAVLERQRGAIAEELRVTSQRVNLFEKVKIPETRENIRVIKIYLGDEQTAAVVRGKIAKNRTPQEGES
jgi:V/A-type H+/Na+-transporting ATPase subunit D